MPKATKGGASNAWADGWPPLSEEQVQYLHPETVAAPETASGDAPTPEVPPVPVKRAAAKRAPRKKV